MQCKLKRKLLITILLFIAWKMVQKYRLWNVSTKVLSLQNCTNRTPDVPPPITFRPTDEEFLDPHDPSKPNLNFIKNHFYCEGRLNEEQALFIIKTGTELLRKEANVLEIDAPITG